MVGVKLWSSKELIHPIRLSNKNAIFGTKDVDETTPGASSSRPQRQVPSRHLIVAECLDLLKLDVYSQREICNEA